MVETKPGFRHGQINMTSDHMKIELPAAIAISAAGASWLPQLTMLFQAIAALVGAFVGMIAIGNWWITHRAEVRATALLAEAVVKAHALIASAATIAAANIASASVTAAAAVATAEVIASAKVVDTSSAVGQQSAPPDQCVSPRTPAGPADSSRYV